MNDDFEFILEPRRKYWFVLEVKAWNAYRRLLKKIWGDQAFSTERTIEHTQEGFPKLVWVVLKIGSRPMFVSADIMGPPHDYEAGDHPEALGVWEEPEPHWIHTASEYAENAEFYASTVADAGGALASDVIAIPKQVVERASEALDAPEKFLTMVEERSYKIATLAIGAGLGAYLIWRMTER